MKSSEGAGDLYRRIPEKIIEYGGALLTATAQKEFEEGRLQDVGKILTRKVNFVPDTLAAQRSDFKEDRGKLNTRPGLIIGNHPGKLDPFLLLSLIERKDMLVM